METDQPNTAPKRIQRQRMKGWRMPPGAVYVGRPTRWGNPFRVGDVYMRAPAGTARQINAITEYRAYLDRWSEEHKAEIVRELRGRDLVCWCPLDQPCHADVLLEIANA